jgi:hypothetical protein
MRFLLQAFGLAMLSITHWCVKPKDKGIWRTRMLVCALSKIVIYDGYCKIEWEEHTKMRRNTKMIWIFLLIFAVKLKNIHLRGDMAAERRNNLATLRRCAAPHSLSLSQPELFYVEAECARNIRSANAIDVASRVNARECAPRGVKITQCRRGAHTHWDLSLGSLASDGSQHHSRPAEIRYIIIIIIHITALCSAGWCVLWNCVAGARAFDIQLDSCLPAQCARPKPRNSDLSTSDAKFKPKSLSGERWTVEKIDLTESCCYLKSYHCCAAHKLVVQ